MPTGAASQQIVAPGKEQETVRLNPVPPSLSYDIGLEPPDVLFRMVQLADQTFVTTNPLGTAPATQTSLIPQWFANPTIAAVMALYTGVRGDFEVTLVINGAGQTFGLYAATVLCNGSSNGEMNNFRLVSEQHNTAAALEHRSFPQDRCVWINPAESKTIKFHLPYASPFAFYTGVSGAWTLGTICYAPVLSAISAASQSFTIRTYMRLLPGAKMGSMIAQSGPVSGPLKTMSDVSAALGYTRSNNSKPLAAMVRRGNNYLSGYDGEETIERVGLVREGELQPDQGIGAGNPADLTFESLCKRPSVVAMPVWNSSGTQFNVIATIPVTPFYSMNTFTLGRDSSNMIPPVAGYVGLPFEWWHATMCYRIIVPASMIHRGGLQVLWTQNGLLGSAVDTTRVANVVADITGPTCIDVRIPMAANTYACRSWATAPFRTDYSTSVTAPYANGSLYIRIAAPLTSQQAQNVQCVVLAWAEDVKFWGPKRYFQATPASGALPNHRGPWSYTLQSADQSDMCVASSTALVARAAEINPTTQLGADVPLSVRAMMQYPCRYLRFALGTDNAGEVYTPIYAAPSYPQFGNSWAYPNQTTVDRFSWAGYYAAMFVGVKASVNDRWLVRRGAGGSSASGRDPSNGVLYVSRAMQPLPFTGSSIETPCQPILSGTAIPMTSGSSFEVQLPWRSGDMAYWPTRFLEFSGSSLMFSDGVSYNFQSIFDATINNEVTLYRSYAGDISVGAFRRTPALYSNAA